MDKEDEKLFENCTIRTRNEPSRGAVFLSFSERKIIEKLIKQGVSIANIRSIINRSYGVVKDELTRNNHNGEYNAFLAQKKVFLNGYYNKEDQLPITLHWTKPQKKQGIFDFDQITNGLKNDLLEKIEPKQIKETNPRLSSQICEQKQEEYSLTSDCPFDLLKKKFNDMQEKIQILEMQINILTKRFKND